MAETDPRFRLRKNLQVQPEYVILGLLAEGPAHGYELFRRFQTSLQGLWHLSESQFYSTLNRARARGLVAVREVSKGGAGERRRLELTPQGQRLLSEWIEHPTVDSARLIHLEFLTRVYFAQRLSPEGVGKLVAEQKASLACEADRLADLRNRISPEDALGALSAGFRENQIRSALTWLEESSVSGLLP